MAKILYDLKEEKEEVQDQNEQNRCYNKNTQDLPNPTGIGLVMPNCADIKYKQTYNDCDGNEETYNDCDGNEETYNDCDADDEEYNKTSDIEKCQDANLPKGVDAFEGYNLKVELGTVINTSEELSDETTNFNKDKENINWCTENGSDEYISIIPNEENQVWSKFGEKLFQYFNYGDSRQQPPRFQSTEQNAIVVINVNENDISRSKTSRSKRLKETAKWDVDQLLMETLSLFIMCFAIFCNIGCGSKINYMRKSMVLMAYLSLSASTEFNKKPEYLDCLSKQKWKMDAEIHDENKPPDFEQLCFSKVDVRVSLTKFHQYSTWKEVGKLRTWTIEDQNPTSKVTALVYMIRHSSQPCTINCRSLIENSNKVFPHVLDVHQYKACVCLDTKLYLIQLGGDEDKGCGCHYNKFCSKDTQKGCEYICTNKDGVSCGKIQSLYSKTNLADSVEVLETLKKYIQVLFVFEVVLLLEIVDSVVPWKKWLSVKNVDLMTLMLRPLSEIQNDGEIQRAVHDEDEIRREIQNECLLIGIVDSAVPWKKWLLVKNVDLMILMLKTQSEIKIQNERNDGEIQRAVHNENEIQNGGECQKAVQDEGEIQRKIQHEGEFQRAVHDEDEIRREIQNECLLIGIVDSAVPWKKWLLVKNVDLMILMLKTQSEIKIQNERNDGEIQRAVHNENEIQNEGEFKRAVQNEGEIQRKIQNEGFSENKVDKKDTWLLRLGREMIKSVEVFCGNATTIQEPVPARLLGMTKQETNNTARFISPVKSVEIDTSPHFCLLCKDLPTSFGLFLCMQEKYKSNMQKEFSHDVEFIFQYNDSEHKTFEEVDMLTDTNNFIEIHSSRYTKEFSSTENEELNNQKVLIGSLENGFGVKLGNINRESSGSVSRDIHRSYRLSTHCPVRGYDCNSVRKLRVQVVPNQLLQSEEQCDVKVVQGTSSKPWEINQNNDIFFNLKYKVNVEKSPKKKIDCTLQEEDFDQMMLLRGITWLPIDQLPVPEIDLTVAHLTNFEPIMEIIDLIAAGTPPTPHISMRYELLRFCTLRSYPKEDKPYLIKLAEAGFYYASDGDGVVCYCCGIRRYNWTAEDNPKKIHERINPSCKFLRKNEEVNVPVQYFGPYSKELMAIMEIPEPIERPQVSEDVNNDWAPERIRTPASQQPNRPNESGTNALGINTAIPKHSQYATKTAREASYSTWPDTSSHTPEVLADAGFFYAGFGDCVRCFYCGIGLRHWTAEDDPWIEHARWSKNCVFVKQKKGEEFVNLVQLAVQYSQDVSSNFYVLHIHFVWLSTSRFICF
ncbi:uncharacterized protein LOC132730958 [Ruditapes philippinarum]|uniref:uncharacterized protein LOC132730958 n=1 Tax=Ruditapes philippinarum TaxID=129788 RepID=UPI00295AC3B4|nr:uncharacterized protein LOC132730958 [Ruditapes philippinarum]